MGTIIDEWKISKKYCFHFELIDAVAIRANRDFQAKRNISGKVNSAVETTQMPADCPGGEASLVQAMEKLCTAWIDWTI